MRFTAVLSSILLLVCSAAFAAATTGTHPFSVQDMLAMDRVGEPQVSPDGQHVVFSVRTTDVAANRGRLDLWMVDSDGRNLRRMTSDPAADSNPRWSPDGRTIYFLSTRSGSQQIWKISADGGEATQVSSLPLDVSNMIVSPDGKQFAFSLEVFPGAKTIDETMKRLDERDKQKASGVIYDQLFIRHWDTWANGTRNHIFVMPVNGSDPVDIMPGMDADAPSKPFGGSEEFTFTPDSKSIVFSARNVGREETWSTNFDLYLAPIDGKSTPKDLTAENKAWDTTPVFAPDGKTFAYAAMSVPAYESDRFRIVVKPWPDGPAKVITQNWDYSASGLVWSRDGKTIYTTADSVGQTSLFAIDAKSGASRVVVRDGTVSTPAVFAAKGAERILYSLDTLKSPVELYSVRPDGTDVKQLTNINGEKLSTARMGDYEMFSFKGANDETVWAYVVKPIDFDPSKKYPVAFLIHGGPETPMGNHFHYRWNPQAYAGRGYAAVIVQFHGTPGYGQAFTESIRGDWGGKPFVDLQKGLAAALDKYKWMDGNRVAALGASYGGYMINWIAGNWPDRFRCLVVHDGNLDERFAYYGTEELWFPEFEHHGTPWDNPEEYEKQNPVNFVKNWKTPTLVIHGALDFRIPYPQGIATFTALQRRGIPSKFLYFPDENHWVLKPANSQLWHDTVLDWLDQWTK